SMGESRNYSDEMALSIDKEIQEILNQAYQRAKQIITEQRGKLETLAVTLLDVETVERPQFEAMMA
ncbi:MAG: cell division protein FtsH, partial [Anaerolineae bacterium]|nr:cell division protein FtsH [Anaerolineae bacterium]